MASPDIEVPALAWWARRRIRFNLILLAAAPASMACLLLLGLFVERLRCFEITAFTIAANAILFALGLAVANVFYFLGPGAELLLRPRRADRFRRILFAAGTGFSLLLVFLPVLLLLVAAVVGPKAGASCT